MGHRLDYLCPPLAHEPSLPRAKRWVLSLVVGGAVWFGVAVIVTGLAFDLSLRTHSHSELLIVASWAALVIVPTLSAIVTVRCVLKLHDGIGR